MPVLVTFPASDQKRKTLFLARQTDFLSNNDSRAFWFPHTEQGNMIIYERVLWMTIATLSSCSEIKSPAKTLCLVKMKQVTIYPEC